MTSIVPANAQFQSGGKPISMPSMRRIVKVFPSGGSSGYNPETNNVIRIPFSPSLGFLDQHQSFQSFRIRPTGVDLSKECRMDKCSMAWVRKLVIHGADGSTLEDVDHYNLLEALLDAATSPPAYQQSIGRALDNAGSVAARNARAAHPAGYTYCSGYNASGILSGETGKLLPLSFMNGELTLELTLAPFKECWVGTPLKINGVDQTMSYTIDNMAYHASVLTFGEEYNAKFQQQLLERGIDMSFSTYKSHSSVLTSSTMDLQISQNSSSVKGVYHVLRSKAKYNSEKYDSLSTFKSGNLESIQWSMGSQLTPVAPLMLKNMGTTSLFANNLQSFNMFRNLSLGSSISDHNFASSELTSGVSGGYPAGSANAYQALPVRRIYGTWVANGREVYEARPHIVRGAMFDGDGFQPLSEEDSLDSANTRNDFLKLMEPSEVIDAYVVQNFPLNSFDPTGRIRMTGTSMQQIKYTHTVPTLSFVPNSARDLHLIESGMRCKIGSGDGIIDEGEESDITGETRYTDLSACELGLDRFLQNSPLGGYTAASAGSKKNTQYEEDSANIMYPGSPAPIAWGYSAVAGSATKTALPETYVAGIGIPFVDGLNRPILCNKVGMTFEGWVEMIADDSQFYLGCSFESAQESPELVSGSNLTGSTPLIVKLQYDNTVNDTKNFNEGRDQSDIFTSFVHIDAVLRVTDSGDVMTSL